MNLIVMHRFKDEALDAAHALQNSDFSALCTRLCTLLLLQSDNTDTLNIRMRYVSIPPWVPRVPADRVNRRKMRHSHKVSHDQCQRLTCCARKHRHVRSSCCASTPGLRLCHKQHLERICTGTMAADAHTKQASNCTPHNSHAHCP
jgi:hypothetical protein